MRAPEVVYHFCGPVFGGPFRAAALEVSKRANVRIVTVVSAKGMRKASPAYEWLRNAKKMVLDSAFRSGAVDETAVADVNAPDFRRRLGSDRPAGIVTGFNQIFDRETIGCFADLVNVHPSILPYYRGPVPTYWCIKNGETKSGFTLHRIDERIDNGEILFQKVIDIEGERDPAALAVRIAHSAVPTFVAYLMTVLSGRAWTPVTVDAASVYAHPTGYAAAPNVM